MNALLRWYRAELDVQAKLPFLAAYMGHVSIVSTAYYLQFVEPARGRGQCAIRRPLRRPHHRTHRRGRCAMTVAAPNDLARALRAFFADHLPRVRGTSPHTIRSYRDSLVLLLRFVATRSQRSVIQLDLDDLDPQPVLAFLQHLELDRHNSVATRNVRLAAIHAFLPVLRHGVPRTARALSTRPRRPVQADRQPPRGLPRARGDRGHPGRRRSRLRRRPPRLCAPRHDVQHRRAGPGNRRPVRRRPAAGRTRAGPPPRQGAEGTRLPAVDPDRRPAACPAGRTRDASCSPTSRSSAITAGCG